MKPGKAGLLGFALAVGSAGAARCAGYHGAGAVLGRAGRSRSARRPARRPGPSLEPLPSRRSGPPVVPDISAVQQSLYGTSGYPGYGDYPGYGGYGGYGGFGSPYGGGGFPYGAPSVLQSSPFAAPAPSLQPRQRSLQPLSACHGNNKSQEQGRTVFGPPSRVIDLSPPTASIPKAGLPAMAVPLLGGRPYTLEQVADPTSDFYGGTGLEGLDARQAELADVAQAVGLKAGHAAEAVAMARALRPYEGGAGPAVRRPCPAIRGMAGLPDSCRRLPSCLPSGLAAVSRSDRAAWRRGCRTGLVPRGDRGATAVCRPPGRAGARPPCRAGPG